MIGTGRAENTEIPACLIIDDPLLRPRYGCLDYEKLLGEMKEHGFFTEIAFIPWNYRRSDQATVRLFADNPDYFGICVHGCNHTSGEFGSTDYGRLSRLSSIALQRMEAHKRLTGLPFDPVMVFPQGSFSSPAMRALKDHGYEGAFNSTLRTADGADLPPDEYGRPATSVYHGLPLFLRRYPRDTAGFVRDLASGRPLIVVEHHGAFRNGYRPVTDLVDWINGLGNISWKSLSRIVRCYYGTSEPPVRVNDDEGEGAEGKKVALRRYASEFRDNYIDTNGLLSKLYGMARAVRR